MTVGERLLHYRLEKGLGGTELAELAGVSRSAIYLAELDKVRPRAKTLRRLADALGVSMRELLGLAGAAHFASWIEVRAFLDAIEARPPFLVPKPEELPTRSHVERYHKLFGLTLYFPSSALAAREDFPAGETIDHRRVRYCEKYQGWFHAGYGGSLTTENTESTERRKRVEN
jgi:transcriptional regulator with XRE-family HTH domain